MALTTNVKTSGDSRAMHRSLTSAEERWLLRASTEHALSSRSILKSALICLDRCLMVDREAKHCGYVWLRGSRGARNIGTNHYLRIEHGLTFVKAFKYFEAI